MTKNEYLVGTIVPLLGKHKVSEILDALMDASDDERMHEMRMWFNEYFGKNSDSGNEVDVDIDILFHEIDHLKMKVAAIERGGVAIPEEVKEVHKKQAVITVEMKDD